MGETIFISYRRGEDAGFAGRLYDRLELALQEHRLFMDVDDIAPGDDFVAVLNAKVAECQVLLAVIGRNWLTAVDARGQCRLDNPEDFVRIEIGAALAQGKRVIPVLIDDVVMPRADQLPDDLKPLARRQGARLSHEHFRVDSDRLIRALQPLLATAASPSPGPSSHPLLPTGRGDLKPLPLGEVGTPAPAKGAAAPTPRPRNGVHIGVDPWALPDLAVFKDIDAPWCPEMVVIPAGTFLMGSPSNEAERRKDEGPQHRVTISRRFALGRYAVTFDEYDYFCDATERCKPADEGWGRGRRPVINVDWADAHTYAQWLAALTGRLYTLPTEAEWEFACRAGTTTPFSFGTTITPKQVNYDGDQPYGQAEKGLNRLQTVPVGSLSANPWGLCEMHGNVGEWCNDGLRTYRAEEVSDPLGPTTISAPRAVRGGSWRDRARWVRSAYRLAPPPKDTHRGQGFRLSLRTRLPSQSDNAQNSSK